MRTGYLQLLMQRPRVGHALREITGHALVKRRSRFGEITGHDAVKYPPEGVEIVPPDEVIVKGCEVFAPEVSVSVPPSNTGLVVTPMVDKPKEPLVTMLVKPAGVGVSGILCLRRFDKNISNS